MTESEFRGEPDPKHLTTVFSNPAFWTGAIATRDPNEIAAIARLRTIQTVLLSGKPLREIPEFSLWLAQDRRTKP